MIKGIFHLGSGIGNQLHRFVGTKIIALEKGEEHEMIAPELFKGHSFMKLDLPLCLTSYKIEHPSGEVIPDSYEGVIDGEFQAEKDFIGHLDEVREWLKVEPLDMERNLCVINFRGGEYKGVSDLFLPHAYWSKAIEMMIEERPDMQFEVHTDDPETASQFFDYPIIKDMGLNWRSIRYAKHLILSNSSFAILPAYLNEDVDKVIAPKYWARYNTKEWINPDNATYSKFQYIHHDE